MADTIDLVTVSGEPGAPIDDKITLYLERVEGRVVLEIPAPGLLSSRDEGWVVYAIRSVVDEIHSRVHSREPLRIHWSA